MAVVATVLVVSLGAWSSTASAHAPIEWSDPKADAVVPELPESVKMRFAEEPVSVAIRSIEQAPKKGMTLNPVRIAERTYETKLPSSLVTRDDGTVVLFVEVVSEDGHKEGGVYLLHVVDESTSTTVTVPKTTPYTVVKPTAPSGTTPPAPFQPPVSQPGVVQIPVWVLLTGGAAILTALTLLVTKLRKSRQEAARARKAAARRKKR